MVLGPEDDPGLGERTPRKDRRRLTRRGLVAVGVGAAATGAGAWWATRPTPTPRRPAETEALWPGIAFERELRRQPRPLALHWLTIDLTAPELRFLVTPGKPGVERPLHGCKTTRFVAEHGCDLAINGDFFYPWRSNGTWDYYPHIGDPVSVQGHAISEGVRYADSDGHPHLTALWIDRENRVTIARDAPSEKSWNAVGGHRLPLDGTAATADMHPRTAVGVSGDGKTLYIVVVDGRQKSYSEGTTERETAALLHERGAASAILLDGGGSATLAVRRPGGKIDILNSPIDCKIPGRERAVANHLGIFAPKAV